MHIKRLSRTETWQLNGLDHCVRLWGPVDAPPLVMLHGIRDASITFQFVVDALSTEWRVVAPDWRGHGGSAWAPGYSFSDYIADLEALLDRVAPRNPAIVIGHSLGGNVATLYAGVRSERIARLVSLDGFGLPDGDPRSAPERLRIWLDRGRTIRPHRPYASLEAMAVRLMAANPRLTRDRALFFAEHLSVPDREGRVWAFDPAHKRPFPTVYRFAETAAAMQAIRAPVLFIGSGTDFPPALARDAVPIAERIALVPKHRYGRIAGTGHNLHHDEPEQVASLIEAFLHEQA